tara:strand:+ start:232 stop:489 length:258 start_codon:yes stop_codon:yes gene_type:complete
MSFTSVNLASTTPQPWKLRPKKNEKNRKGASNTCQSRQRPGEIVVFQQQVALFLRASENRVAKLEKDRPRPPEALERGQQQAADH